MPEPAVVPEPVMPEPDVPEPLMPEPLLFMLPDCAPGPTLPWLDAPEDWAEAAKEDPTSVAATRAETTNLDCIRKLLGCGVPLAKPHRRTTFQACDLF